MKKTAFTFVVLFAAAFVFAGCEKTPDDLIVGKWKFQSEIRERTDLQHPGTVQLDTFLPTNLTMEISHFKKNGTVTYYSEANIVDVGDYTETYDWKLSGDGKTLYLTNGRNNQAVKIGYIDRKKEVLVLNNDELVTRDTSKGERYLFVTVSNYKRM